MPDNERDQNRPEREDPFTRSTRQFDSHFSKLFDTLWGLPAAIYERGNEHGREFRRQMDERQARYVAHQQAHESRDEREDEQEREDGRGNRACGWRRKGEWHRGRRERQNEEVEKRESADAAESESTHDWMRRITLAAEQNAQEADKIYEDHLKRVHEALPPAAQVWMSSRIQPKENSRSSEGKPAVEESWSDLFPAWSAANPHKHTEARDDKKAIECPALPPRHGIIVGTAQDLEDAISRANSDWNALVAGTSNMAKMIQDSYNREARLWDGEGFFGQMPFSGPLSTMFSMGMRPFMPEHSAIGYLLFSEYSPLHLEHEHGFDASFRKRFEDLVRVQSGKDLKTPDEKESPSKVEWLGRMSALLEESEEKGFWERREENWERAYGKWPESKTPCSTSNEDIAREAIMGPEVDSKEVDSPYPLMGVRNALLALEAQSEQRKETHPEEARVPQNDYAEDASEQDFYEWEQQLEKTLDEFDQTGKSDLVEDSLKNIIGARKKREAEQAASSKDAVASAPSILSTLTTTEKHVAADGTVTTKTVLKKHFADGREETESSTTTEEPQPVTAWARQRQFESAHRFGRNEHQSDIAKEAKKSGGWFWR